MRILRYIVVLFLCFGSFGADIVLEHADEIVTDISGGAMRTKLSGSIRIVHENRKISAGFATWDKAAGRLKFINNVVLADSAQIITTDTLHYFRDSKTAIGNGNVVYSRKDSTTVVSGDFGRYDGISEFLETTGSPHLTNIDTLDGTKIDLDAKALFFNIRADMCVAVDSVRIRIQPKDTLEKAIFLTCDSLVFYPSRDEVYAFGGVVVVQGGTRVVCESASYFRVAGRMKLSGEPVVTEGTNRLEGAEMTIELKKDEIKRIIVEGAPERGIEPMGFWRPPEDSLGLVPQSRFTAKQMLFELEQGKVKLAHLVRQANVEYHPMPENPRKRESNITIGDSIAVWFGEDKFDSIEVHSGVSGVLISQDARTDSQTVVGSADSLRYSGDFLALSRLNETVSVKGNAELKNSDMSLSAGSVVYEVKRKILTANPIQDGDSLIGMPVLSEKGQTMTGKKITYNVDTGRGRMVAASTAFDMGFFKGGVVHKAQGETLYVANSEFVPCECETALTHLWSDRLKLIPKEKAVARNIILYIGRLPVIAIPFFVFPVQSGRRSGLLTFDVGQFQRGDRFVRNIGYYWAPSDYWDLRAAFDFDEGKGLVFKAGGQYAVRYKLNGNLSTTYEIQRKNEFLQSSGANRWSLSGSHQQNLWPRGTLTARANFVSDKEFLDDSNLDPQERMQRNLSSSAGFSQSFDWGNLSLSLERNENLETELITSSVPKLRVSRYTRPIFPAENEYNSKFYNKLSLAVSGYSVFYRESDTLGSEEHFGLLSDPALTLPFSLGPYLTLNPRLSGNFVAIDRGKDGAAWPTRFTYNTGLDANTNIYGRIPLAGLLGLKTLKHDLSPKLGLQWTPEFESADNFYSFAGIYASGGSEALSGTYSLTQDFGLTLSPDSLGNEKDIRLATVTTSSGYNFLSETRKMSDLRTSIRTSPASWLSMTAGFAHSFYPETGDEISTLRLLSREITTNLSWRGNLTFGDSIRPVKRDFKANISHYISDRISGGAVSVTHWVKGELELNITENWRIRYSQYYDIDNAKKVSDEIRIWRDIGCWEGTFVWVPSGYRQGWYFKINIKKLPDIKVEGTRGNVR